MFTLATANVAEVVWEIPRPTHDKGLADVAYGVLASSS
jgi:hypothetical protein